MKNKYCKLIAFILAVIVPFVFIGCNNVTATSVEYDKAIVKNIIDNDSQEFSDTFDYYSYEESSSGNRITAYKTNNAASLDGKVRMGLNAADNIRTAYDVEYDYDAEMIYLAVSVFDENDNLLSAMVAEAYPVYYADGSYDALFDIDGKMVYLSEIQSGETEECFFISCAAGYVAIKITAALILAAKATAVITSVVAIGGIAYAVGTATKAKLQERARAAEKEKSKKNPRYYYPATRVKEKVLIAASPVKLTVAVREIVNDVDFWSPAQYMAMDLVLRASGGYEGPEIHGPKSDTDKGSYYYHYHLPGRAGGHAFYGSPARVCIK